MMPLERRTVTRWAVRVRVTDRDGVAGEPFLWSDFGEGKPATLLPSRARARGRATWARLRLKEFLGARRVVATPVRVRVTTTVEVTDAPQKADPGAGKPPGSSGTQPESGPGELLPGHLDTAP